MINFISFIYFVTLKRTATAEEGTVAVEQAWSELASLEQEQERARAERAAAERELEIVRQRGAALEDVRICFQPRKKVDNVVTNNMYIHRNSHQGQAAKRKGNFWHWPAAFTNFKQTSWHCKVKGPAEPLTSEGAIYSC